METAILFFGVSSPIIVEYEETSIRCGFRIAAGIQNHNDPSCGTLGYPIFRTDDFSEETRHLNFAVPLFRPSNREIAVQHAGRLGFTNPATLIDPTATLPRHIAYGSGLYVNAGCIIGSRASLGDWVLVNRGANVGHHAHIGDFVSIGPAAVLSGNTTVGDRATIGAGAIILPKVKIGAGAVVGAGCVVTQDIPAGSVVVGNPARPR